jgi:hypothetical protein
MLAVPQEIAYLKILSWMRKGEHAIPDYNPKCVNNKHLPGLLLISLCFQLFCSLLKIWNLNKLTGVIGVFNCQGAGSWPMKQEAEEIPAVPSGPSSLSGHLSPIDVEFLDDIAGEDWNGDCAVYAFNSGYFSNPSFSLSYQILCIQNQLT